jgi:hypothetical protein
MDSVGQLVITAPAAFDVAATLALLGARIPT